MMLKDIDQQLKQVQGMRLTARNDPQLLNTEAVLLLAQQVERLSQTLVNVTAASDHIRGGYALRVISADK